MTQHQQPHRTTSDLPVRQPGPVGAEEANRPPLTDEVTRVLANRRGVLKSAGIGIGAVLGVGVVAACSSPEVKPEGGDSSAPSTSAKAADGTPTSDIPVGGGTIFADTKTVVTQPKSGTFKAFDARCPHQGCLVAKVADGTIDCPCHGSQFDISSGDRVAGPAPTGLSTKKITVNGDRFTVA